MADWKDWSFDDVLRDIRGPIDNLFGTFGSGSPTTDISTLLRPVDPYNRTPVMASLVGAAGAVGLVMLSGLALGAMAVSVLAMLGVLFLLTEVFGYEISVAPFT